MKVNNKCFSWILFTNSRNLIAIYGIMKQKLTWILLTNCILIWIAFTKQSYDHCLYSTLQLFIVLTVTRPSIGLMYVLFVLNRKVIVFFRNSLSEVCVKKYFLKKKKSSLNTYLKVVKFMNIWSIGMRKVFKEFARSFSTVIRWETDLKIVIDLLKMGQMKDGRKHPLKISRRYTKRFWTIPV